MRKNEKKSWEVKFGLRFILEKCERCMPASAAYGLTIIQQLDHVYRFDPASSQKLLYNLQM